MRNLYKLLTLCLCIVSISSFSGCSSWQRRAAITTLGSAAGGGLAYAASDGDALATGAGAVGGALLTNVALGSDKEAAEVARDEGYKLGQSDAIKRHYAMLEKMEEAEGGAGRLVYYTMDAPTETEDGRVLVPHKISIPVRQ